MRADPLFALAHVAHDVLAGRPSTCPGRFHLPRASVSTSRRSGPGSEVICVDAHDLRREHLLEYAGDLFVVVLPLVLDSTR